MLSDIAVTDRPQYGICQGMQPDICIAVPNQAPVMGNLDAAEPDMITIPEAMHVKSEPGTGLAGNRQTLFCRREIGFGGQFHISFLAGDMLNRDTGQFRKHGVIRGIDRSVRTVVST